MPDSLGRGRQGQSSRTVTYIVRWRRAAVIRSCFITLSDTQRERATQHHFSLSNSTADGKSIHYTKWMLRGDAAACVTPLLKPNGGVGCWLCWCLSMLWWFDRVLANKMPVNRGDVWISYMGSVLLYKPTCGFMQTSVQHRERSAY